VSQLVHFLRVVEAGARLVVDLPWAAAEPAAFAERFGVTPEEVGWVVERGEVRVAEGVLGAEVRLEASLEGHPGGAFRLTLSAGVETIWTQLIWAQPKLSQSPEAVHALARKFAPVLLFSPTEEYFPVSLGTLLGAPAIRASEDSIEVETVLGEIAVPLARLSEFLRYNGHSEYLLDQSAFDGEKVFDEVRGSPKDATVYYSWMEDEASGRAFLNFHMFYAFDPKAGIAKLLGIGPHVFDRESLTVGFDASGRPEALVVSGHMERQRILFFDSLKLWNEGRVRMPFPDAAVAGLGDHPLIPVADGSHALYPAAGLYHLPGLTELAGHLLGSLCKMLGIDAPERESIADHQVLLPPDLTSPRFASYALVPLRLDLLRSEPLPAGPLYDPDTTALVFSGFWVDVPGWNNERFPPFCTRELDPAAWVDGAHAWDWAALPSAVAEHNRALAARIALDSAAPG